MKTPEELREQSKEELVAVFQKNLHLRNIRQTIDDAVKKAVEGGLITDKGGAFGCGVAEEDLSIAAKYLAQHGWKIVCYHDHGPIYSAFEIAPIQLSFTVEKVVLGNDDAIGVVRSNINYSW
ncbi:hypothetical protein HY484_04385 [Candidatus Woesearchaeota archaeon]|nr:hypothetical protein [Candidatus Woesearchaeota archaeon]